MKKLRNFSGTLLSLFFIMACVQTISAKELPTFEKDENYASIRLKMIDAGWKPFHSKGADSCFESDSRCQGRPEMESCAGTGMANCKFLWKKDEKSVAICTVGEDTTYDGMCD